MMKGGSSEEDCVWMIARLVVEQEKKNKREGLDKLNNKNNEG